jgi:hypothetical protein
MTMLTDIAPLTNEGGPRLRLDAVTFCRRLFGRGKQLPYATPVPF